MNASVSKATKLGGILIGLIMLGNSCQAPTTFKGQPVKIPSTAYTGTQKNTYQVIPVGQVTFVWSSDPKDICGTLTANGGSATWDHSGCADDKLKNNIIATMTDSAGKKSVCTFKPGAQQGDCQQ